MTKLIFLNLILFFSYCFSMEENNINNNSNNSSNKLDLAKNTTLSESKSDSDKKASSIDIFFTDSNLNNKVNKLLSRYNQEKSNNGHFANAQLDIIKIVVFDYLLDIKSTEEQVIYSDFKSLAQVNKFFDELGKLIRSQIVIISDKELKCFRESILKPYSDERRILPLIHLAAEKNKALWLINKIKEPDNDQAGPESVIYFINSPSFFKNNLTPLELAANSGNCEVAKVLIYFGADINPSNRNIKYFNLLNLKPTSVLHIACEKLDFKFIKMLINAGADPNCVNQVYDKKYSPLAAVINEFIKIREAGQEEKKLIKESKIVEIVEFLIEHGAEIS